MIESRISMEGMLGFVWVRRLIGMFDFFLTPTDTMYLTETAIDKFEVWDLMPYGT